MAAASAAAVHRGRPSGHGPGTGRPVAVVRPTGHSHHRTVVVDQSGGEAVTPRASRSGRPRSPRAVEAVLASTHEAAATVTVRHGVSPGSPVRRVDNMVDRGAARGASGGCRYPRWPGRPRRSDTAIGASGSPQISATPTVNPPCGASPTASRRRGRPGRRSPAARRWTRRPGRRPTPWPWHPGRGGCRRAWPRCRRRGRARRTASRAPGRRRRMSRRPPARALGEVAVVAEAHRADPTVGSTAPSVSAAARRATVSSSIRSGGDGDGSSVAARRGGG